MMVILVGQFLIAEVMLMTDVASSKSFTVELSLESGIVSILYLQGVFITKSSAHAIDNFS
jgi:hypothetical protein